MPSRLRHTVAKRRTYLAKVGVVGSNPIARSRVKISGPKEGQAVATVAEGDDLPIRIGADTLMFIICQHR